MQAAGARGMPRCPRGQPAQNTDHFPPFQNKISWWKTLPVDCSPTAQQLEADVQRTLSSLLT